LRPVGNRREPVVITDARFGAVIQSFRQVRLQEVFYHGRWCADFSRMSSFVTDFRCEADPRFHVLA
jgi:hypothetical protein